MKTLDTREMLYDTLRIVRNALDAVGNMSPQEQLSNSAHIERFAKLLLTLEQKQIGAIDYTLLTQAQLEEKLKQAKKSLKCLDWPEDEAKKIKSR